MTKRTRPYSPELKERVVREVLDKSRPHAAVAKEFGVTQKLTEPMGRPVQEGSPLRRVRRGIHRVRRARPRTREEVAGSYCGAGLSEKSGSLCVLNASALS
ncbi:transposase [Actinacidiphila oryziradicis]|uniref:Transposase n=1 Tax=Actinacidiphila oryziradicis TaxID=2571141 RepID=A0A4U0S0X8_9ACTN|nr:transposase [Actinacidiphila oryziradicis]